MNQLILPPELTIYQAAEVQQQWLAWVASASNDDLEAHLNGARVADVDGAGIQLLLALQRMLAARGCEMKLDAISPALRAGCAAMGLSDWLNQTPTNPVPEAA